MYENRHILQYFIWNLRLLEKMNFRFKVEAYYKCRGSEWVTPRYASVLCKLFWGKSNFSSGLLKNFCPSLNYLEELFYRTEQIYLLNICYCPALTFWSHQGTLPHSYLRMSYMPIFPFCLWISCAYGVSVCVCRVAIHMLCIKFGYFILLICLMPIWLLNQSKKKIPEGRRKFLPLPPKES